MSAFYLVQRMTAEDSARPGFDGKFRLDYMGAAEFEFGALPASLKRIRDAKRRAIITQDVTVDGTTKTAYFVGGAQQASTAAAAVQAWVDGGSRGHEWAYFAEQISGSVSDWMTRTNAWWDIQQDVMFTLDAEIAERIANAVQS